MFVLCVVCMDIITKGELLTMISLSKKPLCGQMFVDFHQGMTSNRQLRYFNLVMVEFF